MAAYAALVSLINNILTITNHPRLSTSLDNRQIQSLFGKTNFLLNFMEENNYGGSKEAQDVERKIASAAHAAEDLIESHIVDQIHEERLKRSYLLKLLLKCVIFHTSNTSATSVDLQPINEEMDAIVKEANDFKEAHRLGEEKLPKYQARRPTDGGESRMVGLKDELIHLLDELTRDESSRHIISIVGMGGTGKTTLAKYVYEHLLIKEHFDFRAWATVSQQNNAVEILFKLLSCHGEFSSGTVNDLGIRLHQTLWGRRYLIVLDDIWGVEAWDEVKQFFPENENGSAIVLTTRLSNVAEDCGSSSFMMNLLDEENSWKLFCEKAFQKEYCPPEMQEVAEEIVKLCKGLALSIVVVGGLILNSPRTVGYWKEVIEDLESIPHSEEKRKILDVLSLSYNHLPSHLKPCFLYMGVFKEDSEIRVSKIIRYWIAEGFIKPIGSKALEEIAEGFIKDLIDKNLILVDRHHKNGKVGSCGIHDLLRELCIKLAQEEFFHVIKDGLQGTEHRVVIDDVFEERMGLRLPLTRSIMIEGATLDSIELVDSKLLRVYTEHCFNSINRYENVNLRYLEYDHARGYQLKLPSSISLIWNLQT